MNSSIWLWLGGAPGSRATVAGVRGYRWAAMKLTVKLSKGMWAANVCANCLNPLAGGIAACRLSDSYVLGCLCL